MDDPPRGRSRRGDCMIDRLLKIHLDPIARDYRRWKLLRGLAWLWGMTAMVGLGLLLWHGADAWIFLVLVAATIAGMAWVWRWARGIDLDYRAMARRIEEENPGLHALLLTAVEQEPDAATGRLNYLQD